MRTLKIILLFLTLYSCSNPRNDNKVLQNDFPIIIDSTKFIMNLEYEKIKYKKIIDSKREKFNIERINEKHGEKYLFILYLVDSIRVSDDLTLLITYQARNNEIPLDAFYEKYVLTTLNSNKEHIESIEIGKYESHFGFTIVKTSRISENLELIIETTENTEDFETGEIEIVKKSESYNIVQNGQINKHQ